LADRFDRLFKARQSGQGPVEFSPQLPLKLRSRFLAQAHPLPFEPYPGVSLPGPDQVRHVADDDRQRLIFRWWMQPMPSCSLAIAEPMYGPVVAVSSSSIRTPCLVRRVKKSRSVYERLAPAIVDASDRVSRSIRRNGGLLLGGPIVPSGDAVTARVSSWRGVETNRLDGDKGEAPGA